jgi:2'-5' RNA ligase
MPPASVVDGVREALATVSFPAFEAVFDRVGNFALKGRDLHVLQSGERAETFRGLARDVWDAVRRCVKPLSPREINPHVSLVYGDTALPERSIDPVRWPVNDIVLIHSEYRRSTYHELGRWRLG